MKKHGKRRAILILLILCAALIFLVRDSKVNLELTDYTLDIKAPESFSGFKIVQLSDLHGASFGSELADTVREQAPDIIVITGDLISSTDELETAEKLINELVKIADVYFISGNHEFASGGIEALSDILAAAGVKYLRNEYVPLERNGERIILAGVEDPNSWTDLMPPDEFAAELRSVYPDDCVVLLGHRNYWVTEYPELPVQLILSGHEHGGIIRIPGIGGIIGHDRVLFPKYSEGAFTSGSYTMIVSRGLGNSLPIPRLFNRPEIVSVTLK